MKYLRDKNNSAERNIPNALDKEEENEVIAKNFESKKKFELNGNDIEKLKETKYRKIV